MKKQLTKELLIYGGLCLVFLVLTVSVHNLFVFGAVIFGIMAISCAGGALFGQKPEPTPSAQDGLSPFGLNQSDVALQLADLQLKLDQGTIDEAAYLLQKEQLLKHIN